MQLKSTGNLWPCLRSYHQRIWRTELIVRGCGNIAIQHHCRILNLHSQTNVLSLRPYVNYKTKQTQRYGNQTIAASSSSSSSSYSSSFSSSMLRQGFASSAYRKGRTRKGTGPNMTRPDASVPIQPTLSPEEVTEVTQEILQKASEYDKMVLALSSEPVEDSVLCLSELGYLREEIADFFLKKKQHLSESLRPVCELLFKFGFHPKSILKIVDECSNVCGWDDRDMHERMDVFKQIGLSHEDTVKLISKSPSVFMVSMETITNRVSELKLLFKSQDTLKFILNSSSILSQDMAELHQKFEYVFHEMGITQRQMMHTQLFHYSMDHIRARHMYLVRAGFFKKTKLKDGEININPLLQDILDTSDEEFAAKFGNIPTKDYQTFYKLICEEQRDIEEDFLDGGGLDSFKRI